MTDQRFSSRQHIRRDADFQRVYRRRCSAADERLVVCAAVNDLQFPRLGLSVSRKVGTAVARNRWKRVLREAFRLARAEFAVGVDFVVVVRSTEQPTLAVAQDSLVRLARKAAAKLARG